MSDRPKSTSLPNDLQAIRIEALRAATSMFRSRGQEVCIEAVLRNADDYLNWLTQDMKYQESRKEMK